MAEHSLLSPSGAHRWMRCPGSLLLEKGAPDRSTRYADEGSAAHKIATDCLLSDGKLTPEDFLGCMLDMGAHQILVDHEMVESVEQFIAVVQQYAEGGGQILVDKRVDFSSYIGVEGQTGTADVIILFPERVIVIDLKYGKGVKVYAANNEQCRLYALGALHDYGFVCDPVDIAMVIHQPRLEHVDEDCMLVSDLEAWAANEAKPAAAEALAIVDRAGDITEKGYGVALQDVRLEPGEKQCKFCNAKANCPALRAEMNVTVGHVASAADFADLAEVDSEDLYLQMLKVPLIESFCKAIRAETERRLFQGDRNPYFKLVEGRLGNRAWTSEEEAEAAMKAAKVKPDEIYTKKVVSPTQAEKNLKKTKPKVWAALQPLIVRAPGKPSVALATDKRPALAASAIPADFAALVSSEDREEE